MKNDDKKLFFYEDEKERFYSVNGEKITKSVTGIIGDYFPVDWDSIHNLKYYQRMGLDIHKIIEFHLQDKKLVKQQLYYEENYKEKIFIQKQIDKILSNYKIVETMVEAPIELNKVVGRVDLLAKDQDGDYILFDFKTSASLQNSHLLQLNIYAYILKHEYDIDVKKCVNFKIDKETYEISIYEQLKMNEEKIKEIIWTQDQS